MASWQDRAECRGLDMSIQSSQGRASRAEAEALLQVCGRCPVMAECREWAEAYPWSSIVVGGRYYGSPAGRAHGQVRATA